MVKHNNKVTWGIAAAIISILALFAANESSSPLLIDGTPMVLLGLSFISMMVIMTAVSIDRKMRLSLQLLTIYFSIYLLLPGYSHSSINRFPFYNFSYPFEVILSSAWIVTIFLVCVLVGYAISAHSASLAAPMPRRNEGFEVTTNAMLALGLTIVALASLVVFLSNVGLSGAFTLRNAADGTDMDRTSVGLGVALPRTLTFLPVIYATIAITYGRSKRFGWFFLAINLPILLIVNFPLAISRTQAFGNLLLFAVLIIDFKKISRRIFLSLGFVGGALIAMPLFDHFTRQGRTLAELDLSRMLSAYFNAPDFDGFQSVNNAVVYVYRYGLEYGTQLLSAILFFIPRSIWPGKAEPTGSITAEAAGYTFTNISQPLPSEFFVDFGWAGVVIGAVLLGFFFFRFDRWIDRGWYLDMRTRLAAGWMLGFGLPIYRGTLLGVLGPFIVQAVGLWVIATFGMRKVRYLLNAQKGQN